MKLNKFALLAAAAAGAFGASAQAQQAFPPAVINGNGASLPANVSRQIFDCYGQKQVLAFAGATSPLVNIFDFNYATTTTATLGNRFNCAGDNNATGDAPLPATVGNALLSISAANGLIAAPFNQPRMIQPNILINYLSTGSGAGINSFLRHLAPDAISPGSAVALPAGWATYGNEAIQYALSESALSFANLTAYNTTSLVAGVDNAGTAIPAATAATRYGAAIQLPMYIAPVALSYDPVYAKERNGGGGINEYRFLITSARPDGSGGMKLTRAQYCGIYNGTLTNFNQLPTNIVNKDFNDPQAFNVPIRLVARSESSGTTSLFTRAIAAQCGTAAAKLQVNSGVGGNTLPIDINPLFTNSTGVLPAGALSGAFFVKGSAPSITGTEVAGRYMTSNGNDGVAQAVDFHPDPSSTAGARSLNGKMGYNGTDFVLPATLFTGANSYGLNTASLAQTGSNTVFIAPTAANATIAFSTVDPPQSSGTTGAYCIIGACNQTVVNAQIGDFGNRANPLDWVFPSDISLQNTLTGAFDPARPNPIATPAKGYPIVGTSNVLLYTCYFTPATRTAINGLWATFIGATTKDFNNQTFPAALIWNATLGIQARNGLAGMPTGWRNAMRETFFRSSTQTSGGNVLGTRNLWIQSRIPSVPNSASATANSLANTVSNPTCTNAGRVGA